MKERPIGGRKTLRNYEYMRNLFEKNGRPASAAIYQRLINEWHNANKTERR